MFFNINTQSHKHEIVVYSNVESYLNKNFGFTILTMYDLWNSNAKYYISTCLNTTINLLSSPKIEEIFFYVWDLEWTRFEYDYLNIKNIYLNDRVKLIARSDDHAKTINSAWNIFPSIAYDFNINDIIGVKNEKINI